MLKNSTTTTTTPQKKKKKNTKEYNVNIIWQVLPNSLSLEASQLMTGHDYGPC